MRDYESVIICNPNYTPEQLALITEKIKSIITSNGGNVKMVSHWGKRKLAYRIKKFDEGIYLLIEFSASGSCVEKLESMYKLEEGIIRFLTVKKD